VTGIPVGRQADLLFFLHTANVTRPISRDERKRMTAGKRRFKRPEVLRYVLHYADGGTASVPVILEKHVNHWLQEAPMPLEGAAVGWSAGLQSAGDKRATLYSMQVANPRPDVPIKSVDVMPGKNEKGGRSNRAVPAVLAITLGELAEQGQ